MNVTDDELTAILDALTDDGDTYDLDARLTLVLRIEPDDTSAYDHINDADCWGKLEWARNDPYSGRSRRPDHFDGKARIVEHDSPHTLWWQPTPEVWGTPKPWNFDADFAEVRRLLHDGFYQVGLKLRERVTDSWGHAHTVTVDQQWLGGIDSLDNGCLREIVGDLLHDLADEIGEG